MVALRLFCVFYSQSILMKSPTWRQMRWSLYSSSLYFCLNAKATMAQSPFGFSQYSSMLMTRPRG